MTTTETQTPSDSRRGFPIPDSTAIASTYDGEGAGVPPWLRVLQATKLAELDLAGVPLDGSQMILARLIDSDAAGDIGDRACAKCGAVQPFSTQMVPILARPVRGVGLMASLCQQCGVDA